MSVSPPDEEITTSVKHTILHFEDKKEKDRDHRGISRSNSWTPSSSRNSSASSSSSHLGKLGNAVKASTARGKSPKDASQGLLHAVFDESSSWTDQSLSSELQPTVPTAEPPSPLEMLESDGSALHALGGCRPCRFVAASSGCQNGTNCVFCHHPDHSAYETVCHRPSKGVRNSSKKAVSAITSSGMSDEEKIAAYKQLSSKGPYMRHLLREACPELDFSDVPVGNDPKKQTSDQTPHVPTKHVPIKMSL
eukprot:TRINITY_DN41430_c0_g1_i1.p1 TRINITY_DN41430_c0_g1~~TRINITY_DN41430_c0_g1_i1.p1  ORF type:complete len:250 (+),score=27.87 TRINITY_DN41430_c0_g1_i1:340-1089(+)